ncbi:MAG: hypothetical protein M1833_003733 [Piccolia ochrophora]|nr:MAG: hypothetical protein M1833_003733 [Piccolia ochrophora]
MRRDWRSVVGVEICETKRSNATGWTTYEAKGILTHEVRPTLATATGVSQYFPAKFDVTWHVEKSERGLASGPEILSADAAGGCVGSIPEDRVATNWRADAVEPCDGFIVAICTHPAGCLK